MRVITPTDRSAFSLVECIVIIGILTILGGLILCGVMKIRESAARAECQNHLRQIGLGLQLYHQDHRVFPPGNTHPGGEVGIPYGPAVAPYPLLQWHARILPYLEYENLWRTIVGAYKQSGGDPYSPLHPSKVQIALFLCPSDGPRTSRGPDWPGTTSYVGVEGREQLVLQRCA